jgi:hypothetical protein
MSERRASVKSQLTAAFSATPRPGTIRDSDAGDEPALLEAEFRDRPDWRFLEAAFLDSAPDGFASALSFFSASAFRYYLPAFLLADLDGTLERVDPVFHLWHGLDDETGREPINPLRYGTTTWYERAVERFASFSTAEVQVIVAYLRLKADDDDVSREKIEQALSNYWERRLGE